MNEIADTWTVKIDADTTAITTEFARMSQLGKMVATSLAGAFDGLALKGRSLGDVLRTMSLQLSQMVLKSAMKPFESFLGNAMGNMLAGFTGFPGVTGFARGGAFDRGLPIPFAAGGVISSPIGFPLGNGQLGIAGERGAEAIMPLTRGPDGRLGVAANGAGSATHVTFNVTTPDADSFRRSETQIAALLSRAVAQGQRNL